MKRLLVTGFAVAVLAVVSAPAQAGWFNRNCCYETCYVEKCITCYKPEMRTREVQCTVYKTHCKEVIEERKCTVMVPDWKEEKRSCTVHVMKPREVEREITCCKMVATCCTDPCTGCTYTVCKPVTEVKKIKCTVYDCVPQTHEYTVKVCCMKPVEKTYQCKKIVTECKPEIVVRKECYCVMVPYTKVVKVPVKVKVCCKPCCD